MADPANKTRVSEVEVPSGSAADAIDAAPQPSDKAKTVLKVLYPNNNFVIEGIPVITAEGTPLTAEQAKTIEEAAEANGVRIVRVEEGAN